MSFLKSNVIEEISLYTYKASAKIPKAFSQHDTAGNTKYFGINALIGHSLNSEITNF